MPWKPDYVDVPTLADYVRTDPADPYLASLGTAASRAVDGYCNRQFGRLDVAATFTYDACNAALMINGRWLLAIDDVCDATGLTVTVNGASVAAGSSGFLMWPRDAIAKGKVHTGITLQDKPTGDVAVNNRFGWLAYPAGATSAVRIQVNRWFIRRESPYGTAGAPDEGSEVRLGAVLDPDVRTSLAGAGIVRARMPR